MPKSASELFIVDNSDSDWKVRSYLADWCELSSAIDIATGYFEIGALLCLKEQWQKVERIRILMGDEVSLRTNRDELIDALLGAMGRGWTEREDATRAAARWLGFQRTGRAIQDAFKSAINGAIRRGRLEKQGSQIRKSG